MRSITSSCVLIVTFVLHLCASEPEPSQGKKPHHEISHAESPEMMSSMMPDLDEVINVSVGRRYRQKCRDRLRGYVRRNNIDSEDCMYFCGFMDEGVVDIRGNLREFYVRDLTTRDSRRRITSKIMDCASRAGGYGVCSRARNRVNCIDKYISDFKIEYKMMKFMKN